MPAYVIFSNDDQTQTAAARRWKRFAKGLFRRRVVTHDLIAHAIAFGMQHEAAVRDGISAIPHDFAASVAEKRDFYDDMADDFRLVYEASRAISNDQKKRGG